MKEEILKFFKGEVADDKDTLLKYSHDASLLEVKPMLVLYPMDSADVQNLVKWVAKNENKYEGLSITARCAGTDMSGGAIGESLILDFTRHMNKLISGPQASFNKATPSAFVNGLAGVGAPGNRGPEQKYLGEAYITVQPGMFYRDFEKITLEKGLILPCYTASKSLNAMGGMYGNNSAGERTLKYGKTEDYILSAKVIFSDGNEYLVRPLNKMELNQKMAQNDFEGNVYKNIFGLIEQNEDEIKIAKPKVHKNSAGYYLWNIIRKPAEFSLRGVSQAGEPRGSARPAGLDSDPARKDSAGLNSDYFNLNKLLVGSQGTLGIATEITFKLLPENKYSKLVVIFMNDLEPLGRLVDEILKMNPETLETYDDKTMNLAVRFFPDFLKTKGLKGMLKLGWSFLPEMKMLLTGGFPKLILLAEFAGENEAEVQTQCLKLVENIKDFKLKVHITENEAEANKYWDIRRESFALLRKHVRGKRTAPFIDDIIVRPEFLPKFLPELNHILEGYDLTYTLAGHAGDGNFHIIPLMDFSRPDTAKIIIELGAKVYTLVLRYHGSITAEHNDGIIRTPYLNQMYGDRVTALFAQVKKIFDPQNIFNPGKKVPVKDMGDRSDIGPGTKEYIISHIATEHDAVHKV